MSQEALSLDSANCLIILRAVVQKGHEKGRGAHDCPKTGVHHTSQLDAPPSPHQRESMETVYTQLYYSAAGLHVLLNCAKVMTS